jgi:hypothetical protein
MWRDRQTRTDGQTDTNRRTDRRTKEQKRNKRISINIILFIRKSNPLVFSTSPLVDDHWEVTKDEICESEFDEARRCLLNAYNSYIQTHAGYIIALLIGLAALVSAFASFLKNTVPTVVFIFLIFGILILSFYTFLRITYWNRFADLAMHLSLDEVIASFNKCSSKAYARKLGCYTTKPPYLAILNDAICQKLDDAIDLGKASWNLRLAWKVREFLQHRT